MSGAILLLAARLALILTAVLLVDWQLRRRAGASRVLWEATALVLLLAPLASFRPVGVEVAMLPSPTGSPIPPIATAQGAVSAGPVSAPLVDPPDSSLPDIPLAAAIGLFVSGIFLVRRLLQQRHVTAILNRASPVAPGAPIAGRIREAAEIVGITPPPVYWSSESTLPFVAGLASPAVVLPGDAADWSVREQRTVLLHEFVHVRHRDLRHLLVWDLLLAAYWWYPLVWLARRAARDAIEADCDAVAARHSGKVDEYVEDLVRLARHGLRAPAMHGALSFGLRSRLGARVRRLLAGAAAEPRSHRPMLLSGIAALGMAVLGIVPVARSAPQAPEATSTMNVSDGGRDVSSNLAGVQARWSLHGMQHGLFFTGSAIDLTIRTGRVAATDRVLVLREGENGVELTELRPDETLAIDPDMLRELRRIVRPADPEVRDGPSPAPAAPVTGLPSDARHEARAAQIGLPALSDDPGARVIQAGWLQDGVRYAVMARGDWQLRGDTPHAAGRRSWLVIYGCRLSDGQSQWIVYPGDGAPAQLNSRSGALDAMSSHWGAAVFTAFGALVEQAGD